MVVPRQFKVSDGSALESADIIIIIIIRRQQQHSAAGQWLNRPQRAIMAGERTHWRHAKLIAKAA